MNNKTIVKFNNTTKEYSDLIAVDKLNLEIHRGEILGFVGPNGAGKTTTMKMLGGLVKPTSGSIEINIGNGDFINLRENPSELYKRFGFLIDIPSFYGQTTPKKILKYYCKLLGIHGGQIERQIDWALDLVEMSKWKNKRIKEFSKGMVQRLGLAQAIIHDPDVAVLDEPQTGLDPGGRVQVRNIMKKIKELGKTIFLSSHMLYEISEICDRIAVINQGELIAVDKIVNLEQKMTKKEITVELLDPIKNNQIENYINDITERISPYSEGNLKAMVHYNENLPGFQIFYDGKPNSRKEIHDILSIDIKLPIIGFSKVRTSRLEDLYLDLIETNSNLKNNRGGNN